MAQIPKADQKAEENSNNAAATPPPAIPEVQFNNHGIYTDGWYRMQYMSNLPTAPEQMDIPRQGVSTTVRIWSEDEEKKSNCLFDFTAQFNWMDARDTCMLNIRVILALRDRDVAPGTRYTSQVLQVQPSLGPFHFRKRSNLRENEPVDFVLQDRWYSPTIHERHYINPRNHPPAAAPPPTKGLKNNS